jgi:hypothetical protein
MWDKINDGGRVRELPGYTQTSADSNKGVIIRAFSKV